VVLEGVSLVSLCLCQCVVRCWKWKGTLHQEAGAWSGGGPWLIALQGSVNVRINVMQHLPHVLYLKHVYSSLN